jgi:lysyl-tRNA synthetase class 2
MVPPAEEPRPAADPSFAPTAALETLALRSRLLECLRSWFRQRGFWEAETPILSHDVVVDGHLDPFVTSHSGRDELFLQTSPEFAMKRLLAAGARRIFQVTRAFRRHERGPLHNPEFTMVEWYEAGSTYQAQMDVVEELVAAVFAAVDEEQPAAPTRPAAWRRLERPFARASYDELCRQVLGRPLIGASLEELERLAGGCRVAVPDGLAGVDEWLNAIWALAVEPELAGRGAVFVYDYPPAQAALARIRPGATPVAQRFELYLNGVEICNGYQELTDAAELRRRIADQAAIRSRHGQRPLPSESRLLQAMAAGLPECSGVALGFDRLMMSALGAGSLAEVIAFPFDRA